MLACLETAHKSGGGVGSSLASAHTGVHLSLSRHRFGDQLSVSGHRSDPGLGSYADRSRAGVMELQQLGVSDALYGSDGMYPGFHPSPAALWNPRPDRLGLPDAQFPLYPQPSFPDPRSAGGAGTGDFDQGGTVPQTPETTRNGQDPAHSKNEECEREQEWKREEQSKDGEEDKEENQSQKQSQLAETLRWLGENYEWAEGVCLPRCCLYGHYQDFCKKMKFTPAGSATFGKIIRQRFPKLTTRRLGTRGQSKYHYYGIGIKETSEYYHSVYSGKGLTRFSGSKIKTEGSNRKYSLSSKTGTILPEFPEASNLLLPEDVNSGEVDTFISLYRNHCQRILDTTISANFSEINLLLVHFWQGMPAHLLPVLKVKLLYDVIALCDSILYKVMVEVLIPSSIQDFPDSLGGEIKDLAKRLPAWLESALDTSTLPEALKARKMEVVKTFSNTIARQLDYVNFALVARKLLAETEVGRLQVDFAQVDLIAVLENVRVLDPDWINVTWQRIFDVLKEFSELLSKPVTIETFTEWIDAVVDKCLLQPDLEEKEDFEQRARVFLLRWDNLMTRLIAQLTLAQNPSFTCFHLLSLFFNEHVSLVVDTLQGQHKEKELQANVQRHMKNAEEIKMHAKLRTPSKSQNSPKRRRKNDDAFDSNDESEAPPGDENQPRECAQSGFEPVSGTAFCRPTPSGGCRESSLPLSDDGRGVGGASSMPLAPIKPYHGSLNSAPGYHGDRHASYLPVNAHHALSDPFHHVTASRLPQDQSYADLQSLAAGSFSVSSHVATPTPSYWSDSRSRPSLADTYGQYGGYNGMTSQYDPYSLKKPALLCNSVYPDAMAATAFDAPRVTSYYRPPDTYQLTGHLSMAGAYGGNFMEIAAPPSAGSQYSRQDGGGLYHQEELYPPSLPPAMPKPQYLNPFR